ncbi:hypothetical protein Bca101_048669 [Brassica carinata]
MKCAIKSDSGSTSTASLSTTLTVEKDESEIMNPKIFCAVRAGDKESLVKRIKDDAKTIQRLVDNHGNSLLHIAAASGHGNIVDYIVSKFPNLVRKGNLMDENALHVAARAGCLTIVDNNGDTALHIALKEKHEDVAFYLLSVRHDVSFDANNDGVSPLYLAVEAGYCKLVTKMLESLSCPSKLALMYGAKSLVHAAMRAKRRDILGIVLRQNPRLIELRNEEGRTCLSFGASIGFYEGISYILSDFDKAASSLCYVADNDGFFPIHMANILHVAAKTGRSKVVNYLLELDEEKRMMNEQDVDGNTPLHLATKHRHSMVVNILTWNENVKLATMNNDGFTALDTAEALKDNAYILRKIPFDRVSPSLIDNPQIYKDSFQTLMVTATLVATVTFTAGFTLPGGYIGSAPDLGMAALIDKMNFKLFILFNSISMCSSVVTIMALIWAQLGDAILTKKAFKLALPLLVTALQSMAMAFVAGVTLVVSDLPWLSHLVLAIDTIFFLFLMLLIIPYAFSSTRQGFLRHIFYFPYFLMLLAVGDESNNIDC